MPLLGPKQGLEYSAKIFKLIFIRKSSVTHSISLILKFISLIKLYFYFIYLFWRHLDLADSQFDQKYCDYPIVHYLVLEGRFDKTIIHQDYLLSLVVGINFL